jgi:hypothetical protein
VTAQLESGEIAVIEWRRVTTIAWPTLSVIFGFQAYFAESPIQRWQTLYIGGLVLAGLISWALSRIPAFAFSSTPIVLYMLFSPLLLGNMPKNSWMSIGLVTFAAVIYYSTIDTLPLAFAVVLFITGYQAYVAHKDLSSISDNIDISYFYSYFSTLWLLIMGIASIFIRRRYLEVAGSIQESVDLEIDSLLSSLKGLKQINEKDSRNLRLHGTVLNTLIYLRNLIEQNMSLGDSKNILIEEIRRLASETISVDKRGFAAKVEAMVSARALNRIDISIAPFRGEIDSPLVEESCLEIIRELILNSEKHTGATTAALTITKKVEQEIRITMIDNSISQLPLDEKYIFVEKTKDSRTLQNLLVACGATIKVSLSKKSRYRKIEIRVPYIDLELELKSALARSRVAGLNDFSLNYVRAGALVALLSLPGYFFAGLKPLPLLLTVATVLGFYLVLRFPDNKALLSLLLISSLLIVPTISHNVAACSDLSSIPWLFNHILTVGFFASIKFKNQILKWLPMLIFTAECFLYPLAYPKACQNIFLGSLPGIPLIIVLALTVLSVRKREVNFDKAESLEVARIARVLTSSDNYRESAYTALLQDLTSYADYLDKGSENSTNIATISLQIQKIHTFLVCAEHFDSELIRKTFELFREKQLERVPGRLTLLGENFSLLDINYSVDKIVERLRSIKADSPANLTIVNVRSVEFHFDGAPDLQIQDSIEDIPVFINR